MAESRTLVRLLLDTAFCLSVIRTRSQKMLGVFNGYSPGEVAVSSMTVAALRTRVARSDAPGQNRDALDQFLLPLAVVDFDAGAAQILGRIAPWWPEPSDPSVTHAQFLAAQTLHLGATLVTSRPDLYAQVPQLKLNRDYADAAPLPPAYGAPGLKQAGRLSHATGRIVIMGSHDMTLDLLADSLQSEHPELTLVSAHVGSLQGLLALQQQEAHLAGTHLLDAESGIYNTEQIRSVLMTHGVKVKLIAFVRRVQGFIVARGNPHRIQAYEDLVRPDIRYVNRRLGSGTRVLLDYELARRNIPPPTVRGYDRGESSHMAVALAVAGGTADCGLGIQAAAQAHDLGFVPLSEEQYDLVIPDIHYTSSLLAPLLEMLRRPTSDFLLRVAALGGYRTENMGALIGEF